MKSITYTISIFMIVTIPILQIVSNSIKEDQFTDPYPTNDIDVFVLSGLIDLTLFLCILLELFIAACVFFFLSRRYEIKFQIS